MKQIFSDKSSILYFHNSDTLLYFHCQEDKGWGNNTNIVAFFKTKDKLYVLWNAAINIQPKR